MRKILYDNTPPLNQLPLFNWASRKRLYRSSPAGRRLQKRFGLDPSTAELTARLAGLLGGEGS